MPVHPMIVKKVRGDRGEEKYWKPLGSYQTPAEPNASQPCADIRHKRKTHSYRRSDPEVQFAPEWDEVHPTRSWRAPHMREKLDAASKYAEGWERRVSRDPSAAALRNSYRQQPAVPISPRKPANRARPGAPARGYVGTTSAANHAKSQPPPPPVAAASATLQNDQEPSNPRGRHPNQAPPHTGSQTYIGQLLQQEFREVDRVPPRGRKGKPLNFVQLNKKVAGQGGRIRAGYGQSPP